MPLLVSLYGEAKRLGFGTTIHAGEASGPTAIQRVTSTKIVSHQLKLVSSAQFDLSGVFGELSK